MAKSQRVQVILLVADGFDEASVTIVLTTLREVGLAVRLVGLRSTRVSGAHGLVIIPNTSLDRVIKAAAPMLSLILPSGAGHLARLRLDPRVGVLLQQGIDADAVFVGLGDQATDVFSELTEGNGETLKVISPETGTNLEQFACDLAEQLVAE